MLVLWPFLLQLAIVLWKASFDFFFKQEYTIICMHTYMLVDVIVFEWILSQSVLT